MLFKKKENVRGKLKRYEKILGEKAKKLNFGCGYDIKKGWVNLDKFKGEGVNVVHNFNEYPYPFPDNTFDLIYSWNSIEHLKDGDRGIRELHRILKPNGVLLIHTSYFNAASSHKPTHFSFWSWDSFAVYSGAKFRKQAGLEYAPLFNVKRVELIPSRFGKLFPKFLRYRASLVLGEVIHSIEAELIALK